MAPGLIAAAALATAALVPVFGEATPAVVFAAAVFASVQKLPKIRVKKLEWAMARTEGPERRKAPRRDEDRMPMERIKTLEKNQAADRKELRRHVEICEEAGRKNEADNQKIIKMQGDQNAVLAEQNVILGELQQALPWIREQYKTSKWWSQVGRSIAEFMWGMVRKNWDSLSGKLIFIAFAAYAAYHGVPWTTLLKALLAG